jgi:predicted transcriptional regulator of viral defense system
MRTLDFIETLKRFEKAVFTTTDIAKIINKDKKYTRLYLLRLKNRGVMWRIERGKYALKNTHPFILASNLIFPSYISFLAALSYYGFTSQMPRIIYVVALKAKREVNVDDCAFKFVKFKKERFFGYKREVFQGKFIFIAELEKLIVDSLFLQKYCPIDEIFNGIREAGFDLNKLLEYGVKMNSIVVLKRLGYLLDLRGFDTYDELKGKLNNKFDLLNPLLPRTKEKNSKWKLIINQRLEYA